MRGFTLALCSVGLLLYPLMVYNFASDNRPALLVAALAVIFILRLLVAGELSNRNRLLALLLLAGFCVLSLVDEQLKVLRLYPVLMSFGGAAFCLYTLVNPPSAIERFARRFGMDIPDEAVGYLRGVTIMWLCFFCLNALIAAYTAVVTQVDTWALYNGLISYLVIGLMLIGEWLYRQRYQRLHSSQ